VNEDAEKWVSVCVVKEESESGISNAHFAYDYLLYSSYESAALYLLKIYLVQNLHCNKWLNFVAFLDVFLAVSDVLNTVSLASAVALKDIHLCMSI
jgi:hypothetical protein